MVESEALKIKDPVSAIAKWLDNVDILGSQIPRQDLTNKDLLHPLNQKLPNFGSHQANLELGIIITDILNNPLYFQPEQAAALIKELQAETYLKKPDSKTAPQEAVNKLIQKQEGYLPIGESWQFAKVGLEINPHAQRIAYKLHALQELLEPFTIPGATEYEDQLADIFTKAILDRADQFKSLSHAIGPYPASVRWMDFLPGAENAKLYNWIKSLQLSGETQDFPDILLSILATKSVITPETTIQILERKTFRSVTKTSTSNPEKVEPLRPEDVADPHTHTNKVELYLPLMGPGMLKVKFKGEERIHNFTPSLNMPGELDLSTLGAKMIDGVPILIYQGKEYKPEGYFINVPLGDGKVMQWIVVKPGDIHDYQNVGISPASTFALTLSFPKAENESIEDDFIPSTL